MFCSVAGGFIFWVPRTSLHVCCLLGSQDACAVQQETLRAVLPLRRGRRASVSILFPTSQPPRLVEGKALSLEQQSSKKTTVAMGCSIETARLELERRQEEPWRLTRERSKRTFLPRAVRAALTKSSPSRERGVCCKHSTARWMQRVSPAHPWAFPHPRLFAE